MQRDKWIVVAAVVLAVLYALATEQIGEPVVGDPLGPKAVPRLAAWPSSSLGHFKH